VRKWVTYLALAAAALGVGGVLAWRTASRQPKPWADAALASYRDDARYDGLTIRYPLDETLFPPEIAPPTFRWEDHGCDANGWLVVMEFQDDQGRMSFPVLSPEWTPSDDQWERIKRRSLDGWTKVTVLGVDREASNRVVSGSAITIKTSQDKVGAPLFFREVNLPFLEAVKDPSRYIRWRFGPVSSKVPPPIVLEKLPVCGNCHSFSADGKTLALEVDSGNDKGAYAIAPVERNIVLDPNKIITWSDYRREDNEVTFGLLCQASPDGRYVVGTVKDRALAVYRNELAFSQLFFLVKGILAIYDRQTRSFYTLPGADDRRHVQTNGTWSPDGKYIVFARSRDEAYDPPGLRHVRTVLVPRDSAKEFLSGGRKFRYDLYRIPFNGGQGGRAEPLEGASNNGMSNYFAKYSPDGKWIVFCKADSFMLLQPDSELYIIPAEGGEARRLRANTERMNSWHSWSPNGRWLVFSSKANTVYTQLFLTHIDEQGRSSPPVVLSQQGGQHSRVRQCKPGCDPADSGRVPRRPFLLSGGPGVLDRRGRAGRGRTIRAGPGLGSELHRGARIPGRVLPEPGKARRGKGPFGEAHRAEARARRRTRQSGDPAGAASRVPEGHRTLPRGPANRPAVRRGPPHAGSPAAGGRPARGGQEASGRGGPHQSGRSGGQQPSGRRPL
jgi:hypothetical protein